jgi:hypothetical protein
MSVSLAMMSLMMDGFAIVVVGVMMDEVELEYE